MNCRNGNFWRSHNEPTRLPVNSQLGWSSKFQNGEFKLAIEFTVQAVCLRHHGKFLYSNFNQSRSLYDSNCHSIRLIGKTFNEKRNMYVAVFFLIECLLNTIHFVGKNDIFALVPSPDIEKNIFEFLWITK